MLETDPTATVDDLEHDLADLDEAELSVEQHPNGGSATTTDDEAATAISVALAPPVEEPTEVGDLDAVALDGLGAHALPAPTLPFLKRKVYGRYRSSGTPYQVELRVDVDGPSPTMRISADYYAISGATVSYFGSMRVDAPTVAITASHVVIKGLGRYTWAAGATRVKVTIPRVPTRRARPPRRCSTPAERQHGCDLHLPLPRPSLPGPRVRAGLPGHGAGAVCLLQHGLAPLGRPGADGLSDLGLRRGGCTAALDRRQQRHLNRRSGRGHRLERRRAARLHAPALLALARPAPVGGLAAPRAAARHRPEPLRDHVRPAGQGSGRAAPSSTPASAARPPTPRRLQLYTCIHELGHCFNLLHSWQKSLATPPQPNRPASPSWMNYPWRFPGGPAAFWTAFPFRFDDQELVHVRHGFRNDVIMGGNPFGTGAALEDLESWREPVEDRSGSGSSSPRRRASRSALR